MTLFILIPFFSKIYQIIIRIICRCDYQAHSWLSLSYFKISTHKCVIYLILLYNLVLYSSISLLSLSFSFLKPQDFYLLYSAAAETVFEQIFHCSRKTNYNPNTQGKKDRSNSYYKVFYSYSIHWSYLKITLSFNWIK